MLRGIGRLRAGGNSLESQVAALFASGEQGFVLPPLSDFSKLFQADGVTPVTAAGQAVGKALDVSGRGNHLVLSNVTLGQDASGRYYLAANGSTSQGITASIDFTGTDKMTVVAGFRREGTTTLNMLVELSAAGSAGSFYIAAPYDATREVALVLNGTGTSALSYDGLAAPAVANEVVSCAFDIAGATVAAEIVPRLNGATGTLTTFVAGPAGTGNFGNHPLNVLRRGGASLPFTGRLYSLIVRGAASSAAQISAAEAYANSLTGAY